jgi:rare lipoprotein A
VVKEPVYEAVGLASYYGRKFNGRRTASGERYDMHAMTAAHPGLEFGSRVEVTNLKNGRKVQVRINDRGPFIKGRIIDLSYAAAKKIGMLSQGVVKVRVRAVP